MKSLLLILSVLLSSPIMALEKNIWQAEVPSKGIYIPKGYDTNDDIELIAEGYLPNLCYKNPHTLVTVEQNKVHVTLQAWTNDNGEVPCAEMIVPFIHTFSVGVLDRGNYEVLLNGKKTGELFVEESSSSAIDDLIYANVEVIERVPGENKVIIHGHHPSFCLEFNEFQIFHNDKDVFSVLPVMKQVSDFCPLKMTPFSLELEVPSSLENNPVLLHVRSMNGKSVNSLFMRQ